MSENSVERKKSVEEILTGLVADIEADKKHLSSFSDGRIDGARLLYARILEEYKADDIRQQQSQQSNTSADSSEGPSTETEPKAAEPGK